MSKVRLFIALSFFLFLIHAPLFPQSGGQQQTGEKLNITAYFPSPQATYRTASAQEFSSPITHVYRELIKRDSQEAVFRVSVDPYDISGDPTNSFLRDPDNFTSSQANNIRQFITNPSTNVAPNLNLILNQLTGSDIKEYSAGSSMITNEIEHMTSLEVKRPGLNLQWQEYNRWPGMGNCRLVGPLPFVGFLATACRSNEYLSNIYELPGVVFSAQAGLVGSSGGDDFTLGLNTGLKVGLYGYSCCELFQETNVYAPDINSILPCQHILRGINVSALNNLQMSSEYQDIFINLAQFDPLVPGSCYEYVSNSPIDENSCSGFVVSVDAKKWGKRCGPLGLSCCSKSLKDAPECQLNGTDGVPEWYCYTESSLLLHPRCIFQMKDVFINSGSGLGITAQDISSCINELGNILERFTTH